MDKSAKTIIDKRIEKTISNLKKNNYDAHYAENADAAVQMVKTLLKEGETVAVGGSVTLFETGVMDLLRSGQYNFVDRYEPTLDKDGLREVFLKSFYADTYLMSSNAITENGELYNVDGASNRTAALLYGPKSVIVVAGYNKIVKDIGEAVRRVKTIAAPANCIRLGCNTYCAVAGECKGFLDNPDDITSGCAGDTRICCNYVICARQRVKDRIKVIIVGEQLGY